MNDNLFRSARCGEVEAEIVSEYPDGVMRIRCGNGGMEVSMRDANNLRKVLRILLEKQTVLEYPKGDQ